MAIKKAKLGRGPFRSGNLFVKSKKLFSVRLVLMGLPIILALVFAIYQFNRDLSSLLLSQQERIMSSVAERYVQAVESRLQADQAVLDYAATQIKNQGADNQVAFLGSVSKVTKVPDFLIASVAKDGIVFKEGSIELSKGIGNDSALTLSRPIATFNNLIAAQSYSVFWVKGKSEILWSIGEEKLSGSTKMIGCF